jgi:antitoxin CcdA
MVSAASGAGTLQRIQPGFCPGRRPCPARRLRAQSPGGNKEPTSEPPSIATIQTPPASSKATNVTVDAALLAQAKALKINVSQAAEAGLRAAAASAEADRWLAQNAAALDSSNDFVERHGLPLARFRRF